MMTPNSILINFAANFIIEIVKLEVLNASYLIEHHMKENPNKCMIWGNDWFLGNLALFPQR